MLSKFAALKPTLKRLFKKEAKPPLGRWSLIQDEKLYRRSDLSNEDHCGPCGEYVMQKRENKSKKPISEKLA